MSEARTTTTEARPLGAPLPEARGAVPDLAGEAAGAGKHRGPAAPDDAEQSVHGRHRRPEQTRVA